MEIRKRFTAPDVKPATEAERKEDEWLQRDVNPEDDQIIPGIPPRSRVHGIKPKQRNRLRYFLYPLFAAIVAAGGAWWWTIGNQSPANRQLQADLRPVPSWHETEDGAKPVAVPPVIPELPGKAVESIKNLTTPLPVRPVQAEPAKKPAAPSKPRKHAKFVRFYKILRHKVQPEETLYRISIQYYHSGRYASFLARYNKLRDPADLKAGTSIRIPFPPLK